MSFGTTFLDDALLTDGVMSRRCVAWVFDIALITLLVWACWWVLVLFGLLTIGLDFGAISTLAFVPFFYHFLSLVGASGATPGQQLLGLTVRRDNDLGPPRDSQALVSIVAFYLTLATSGALLVVALFTRRHRTLHDLVSGLVVVRVRTIKSLTGLGGDWSIPGGTYSP